MPSLLVEMDARSLRGRDIESMLLIVLVITSYVDSTCNRTRSVGAIFSLFLGRSGHYDKRDCVNAAKGGEYDAALVFVHGSGGKERNIHWTERFATDGAAALVGD